MLKVHTKGQTSHALLTSSHTSRVVSLKPINFVSKRPRSCLFLRLSRPSKTCAALSVPVSLMDSTVNRFDLLGLHGVLSVRPGLAGCRREKSYINIIIRHKLLQRRHDLVSDDLLTTCAAGEICRSLLLHLYDGGRIRIRQALEDIDEDSVRFGDVEADVGNGVRNQRLKDGKNRPGYDRK